jgi:hypothetical protein
MTENYERDYGNWKYQDNLDGYGNPVEHAWENDELNGVIKISTSEGGHIMKCERGESLLTLNFGGGQINKYYCFEDEETALRNLKDLVTTEIRDE